MSEIVTEELETRIAAARGSRPFQSYLRAREAVLSILENERRESRGVRPSAYWQEELANFAYMFDASPLIVEKLRHHCFHVTGLKAYDYRSNKDKAREELQWKLNALIEVGGGDLLVPESPLCGGFGFGFDGGLYNLDTLKYFESMIVLQSGAVLSEFGGAQRRVVWEIGGGWGGLAYQFKTLFPNTTYVITDFPELFLFSATYLMTVFPEARVAFWVDQGTDEAFEDWGDLDFVFVPTSRVDDLALERLDLTVNTVSFQEMTAMQVRSYIQRAHELDCPYLYSHNRERSLYNTELESVREEVERWYWPHEISVLSGDYTALGEKARNAKARHAPRPDFAYKHLLGFKKTLSSERSHVVPSNRPVPLEVGRS